MSSARTLPDEWWRRPSAAGRTLMSLLVAAFLLLLGSDANGRTRIAVHRHHSSHPGIGAANHGALLAATPVPNPRDADTAPPPLLASDESLSDRRVHFAPAPARDSVSLCSYERTPGQAARPPPLQA